MAAVSPGDVLRMQMDLLHRLDDRRFRAHVATTYAMDQGHGVATDPRAVRTIEQNAARMGEVLRQQVQTAYAYRVTEDMSLMVQQAASSLDGLDQWDRDLAPTGAGIVRFDRPLPITDIRGATMLVHWAIWGPISTEGGHPSTMLTYWNDSRDPDDIGDSLLPEGIAELLGYWRWCGSDLRIDGARLGPAEEQPSEVVIKRLADEGQVAVPSTSSCRYMHALWLMLNQTITAVENEEPERQARRAAQRMRIPAQVSVVRLRRQEYAVRPEGESQVEWAHRWVVRGHWAWRKCGPDLAGAVPYEGGHRRRLWVQPYVKGPEGKPLVVTDKVYQLQR